MSKVSVFDHGWIDLVFEGRNQNYGAYQLRKQDPKTTLLALITGISVVVSLVAIPAVINKFRDAEPLTEGILVELPKIDNIEIATIETPKPKVEQQAAPAAPQLQPTTELKPLAPVSTPLTDPPQQTDFSTTDPGQQTAAGNPDGVIGGTSPDPVVTPGTGSGGTGSGTTIETFVDVAPLYPGGLDRFYKDVARNFKLPDLSSETVMKVYVSFVVEPDGTLSNIKATRDPGYGMGQEAVRVLKSLKAKWTPGMKGGKAVRTAYSLPITLKVH